MKYIKMKKLYEVTLKEVHHSIWQVTADSEQDAYREVLEGGGEEIIIEYSHTIEDEDAVNVRKLKD